MRLPDPASRFMEALATLPCPGGNGYHPRLLGVANIGLHSGLRPEEVATAIRANTPQGGRQVPDREIAEAVIKARDECRSPARKGPVAKPPWRPPRPARPVKPVFDAAAFMAARLTEGAEVEEFDIREASPIRLDSTSEEDSALLLRTLYAPDDVLFIGDTFDRRVKRVDEWLKQLESTKWVPPHVIPNPLTGQLGLTKNGRPSFRADGCVKSFRFAVAEFDRMSREDQVRFWWAVDLPICALIDSGGKSLHAWIRVDGVQSTDLWTELVERRLFGRYLMPLGCDAACRNEARLSRLPGHFRSAKGRWQHLLYLAPEGRAIHAGA